MNSFGKDYLYSSVITALPMFIGIIFLAASVFIIEGIWGTPIRQIPRLVIMSIFWLICSISGILMTVKRTALGELSFTAIHGKRVVIIGAVWLLVCMILCAMSLVQIAVSGA